jgi:dGTPase
MTWTTGFARSCCGSSAEVTARIGEVPPRVLRAQLVPALINRLVTDLVEATAGRVDEAGVASVQGVRGNPATLVGFSAEIDKAKRELKRFLHQELYHHPHVVEMSENAARILGDLFRAYREDTSRLPEHVRARFSADGEARAIADYVAGMTDRFAIEEHRRGLGGVT